MQILTEMRRSGSRYTESTIRTHVTSRMWPTPRFTTAPHTTTSNASAPGATGCETRFPERNHDRQVGRARIISGMSTMHLTTPAAVQRSGPIERALPRLKA